MGITQRVLVVDDYPDTVEAICMMLDVLGHISRGVVSGEEALIEAERFQPAVALIDLSLPGIDGYEVARRMRASGSGALLVALTGWGLKQNQQSVLACGFDRFLLKPAGLDALRRLLDVRPRDTCLLAYRSHYLLHAN